MEPDRRAVHSGNPGGLCFLVLIRTTPVPPCCSLTASSPLVNHRWMDQGPGSGMTGLAWKSSHTTAGRVSLAITYFQSSLRCSFMNSLQNVFNPKLASSPPGTQPPPLTSRWVWAQGLPTHLISRTQWAKEICCPNGSHTAEV